MDKNIPPKNQRLWGRDTTLFGDISFHVTCHWLDYVILEVRKSKVQIWEKEIPIWRFSFFPADMLMDVWTGSAVIVSHSSLSVQWLKKTPFSIIKCLTIPNITANSWIFHSSAASLTTKNYLLLKRQRVHFNCASSFIFSHSFTFPSTKIHTLCVIDIQG